MHDVMYHDQTGIPCIFDPSSNQIRMLAVIPDIRLNCGQVVYAKEVIPRTEWYEKDYSHFTCPVLDQLSFGACGGFSTCTAFTRNWLADGRAFYRFSPWFIYGTVNGGRDDGSNISDLLNSLKATGVCLESEVGSGNIYMKNFPKQAFETAKRFRIAKAEFCANFDSMASGILRGDTLVYGIQVGSKISNKDAGGVPGTVVSGERTGGHALEGHGLVRVKAGKFAGRWGIKTQNSWGSNWGSSGKAILVEEHFQNHLGAFVIKVAADDPKDDSGIPAIA